MEPKERVCHKDHARQIIDTLVDMSQFKVFVTDGQTNELVFMFPAFAKAWGTNTIDSY